MRQIQGLKFSLFTVLLTLSFLAAQEKTDTGKTVSFDPLKKVEAKFVCMGMGSNRVFDHELIPAVVDDKTYYGCCDNCKTALLSDSTYRYAIDPVSKVRVDKATAVIGALPEGEVRYFENESNMLKFASQLKAEKQ
jgi:YHS domain-containing protein